MCKIERYVGFLFVVALLVPATHATAATYYVSPSGNDGRTCTEAQSQTVPRRTIEAGIDCLSAGDTLVIRNGTYHESPSCSGLSVAVCMDRGGTNGNWVTIRAESRWGAVVDGSGRDYGILMQGAASFVRIEGFEVTGASYNGIHLNASGSDIQVNGNHIHHNGRVCSDELYGKSGIHTSYNNVSVIGNMIHDNGRYANGENGCSFTRVNLDHGIYATRGSNLLVANNVLYNHARGWAVQLYDKPMSNVRILNNTFAFPNPNRDGHIVVASDLTNSEISNNISYGPTAAFLRNYGTGAHSGLKVRNNLVHGASLWTSTPSGVTNVGNIAGDPLFVSVTSPYSFALQSTSPAIDSALALADVTSDFEGVARPQGNGFYDIGAHEHSNGASSPPAPVGLRILGN